MGILKKVSEAIERSEAPEASNLAEALREAERLADLFSDVRPQPYIVPIERYAGLAVFERRDVDRG